MLYVVHTIPDQVKRTFKEHKPAFAYFKMAAKRKPLAIALWHQDKDKKWKIVHYDGFYPTDFPEPYLPVYDSHKKGVA